MDTQIKRKWFYPFQENVEQYLRNNYGQDAEITTNFQDIKPAVVSENFRIINDNKTYFVHVIMNKRGVIGVYEMKSCYHFEK